MIQTVCNRFVGATKREIENAFLARTVQRRIGHPPNERFKEIVDFGKHGLRNCLVTASDVSNSPIILCPNHPRIWGTTTRDTKVLRAKEQRIVIFRNFYKIHKTVTITADIMFVNGILFLVTFSRKIKSKTA